MDPKADLSLVARRVLWGRFSNAGQICNCPEYVLVPEEVHGKLVETMKEVYVISPDTCLLPQTDIGDDRYASFYPGGAEKSHSFGRIVTTAHATRIKKLIDSTEGEIICGGQCDVENRFVAPTIVDNVHADDALMSEYVLCSFSALHGC